MCYIYIRLLFGIACLAYHTAIKFALYQPLYPEFIVNYCFDIKRAAATFALFACTLNGKHKLYSDIVNSLIQPGEQIMQNDKKKYSHKPGWAEYVDDLYDTSREIRQIWINAGKPRQGPVHDQHVKCKSRFKYALRFIKNNENKLRKEALAKKLADLNPKAFWSEIKNMNNCKTPLPTSIEGVSGRVQIVEFWRTHFSQLLNCVSNSSVHACEYGCDTPYEELVVSIEEVTRAIEKLDLNKACGSDGICSEHLKYSSNILVPLLAMCFTSFFSHGFLPETMLSVMLVPVIKDKAGKISSKDNYRPIAFASVISKLVEVIMLDRIEMYMITNPNQFGFKRKHGTDQCIYVLKEIIDLYRKLNGSVFVCFLDASKAFYRVNHTTLFKQLGARGIPGYILRILSYWYKNQDMCIRWGDAYSAKFKVTNGVRQGGILSPYLFNVYVDELSEELNKCNVGCNLNGLLINHLMYADDLVLISPSSAGLSQLLRECEKFGTRHDVKYNAKKSAVMIYRSMTLKGCTIPNFNLNGMILHVVASYKYLGHYITDDFSDDDDINRQRRTLFVQGNIILRKFNMCSLGVKLALFRTYCSPMYTAQLWWNYKKSTITKLQIAYHNIFKMFLGMSKYESTSYLCTLFDIQCCQSVIRKLVYGFMCRLDSSVNCIIKGILATSLRYTSRIRKHWCSLLYINN